MPTLSAITSPDQPLITIVSPDSRLRIDLARLVARLNALALVVLDLDVMAPVLAPYVDVSLAIIDDRSPGPIFFYQIRFLVQQTPMFALTVMRVMAERLRRRMSAIG